MQKNTLRLDATSIVAAEAAVAHAVEIIRTGGVVAFPTETVYGLGASAVDPAAIGIIFSAKGRPQDNPLIVHVDSLESMALLGILDNRARKLVTKLMPGPLTIVVDATGAVPSIARAGLDSIALRIPDHPIARRLAHLAGPLVAPSANISGRPSPTDADAVLADLDGRIDAVLDSGPCVIGIESTVLDIRRSPPVVLRPGIVTAEQIAAALGETSIDSSPAIEVPEHSPSPGTRYRHYAPATPIRIVRSTDIPVADGGRRLFLQDARFPDFRVSRTDRVVQLTEGDFYRSLRMADSEEYDEIIVVADIDTLSPGLRDRLLRAAAK